MSARLGPQARIPVAVLILNWNGRALTEQCLRSWRAARPAPARILVVDNGSTDGSLPYLRRRFRGVEFLALPENLGFAAGNNRGFEALWRRGARVEAVFVCNNDTEVDAGMLGRLWQALQARPDWGAAGPRILFHGRDRIWFEGARIRPFSGRSQHLRYLERDGPAGPPFELPALGFVTGCGLLVRTPLLRSLGGFDESLWAYAEDSDLCLSLRALGYASAVVPAARMSHKVSASFGFRSPRSLYFDARNSARLLRRHAIGFGPLTLAAFGAVCALRSLREALFGMKGSAAALLAGLRDGALRALPQRQRMSAARPTGRR